MNLKTIPNEFAICTFKTPSDIPKDVFASSFWNITRVDASTTLICEVQFVSSADTVDPGWSAIEIEGPLKLSLTGVLSSVLQPLSESKISIFSISTYETDYILVKSASMKRARSALNTAGFRFIDG
jgi:uncharacterized protein